MLPRVMALLPDHRRLTCLLPSAAACWLAGVAFAAPAVAAAPAVDPAAAATPTSPARATAAAAEALPQAVSAADDAADLRLDVLGRIGAQHTSSMAVDSRGGTAPATTVLDTRLRLRLHARSTPRADGWFVEALLSGDAVDGTAAGGATALRGDKLPGQRLQTFLPQQAWIALRKGQQLGVQIGLTLSQWGLGLLANDGSAELDPGRNPWFTWQRSGDRVVRAQVYAMPLVHSRSALRGWLVSLAADAVVQDDIGDRALGERAHQVVAATRLYLHPQRWVGVYVAHRSQRHDDGKELDATAVDVAGDLDWRDGTQRGWRIQSEAVWLSGTTTLGPTPEHPRHALDQLGGLLRVSWSGAQERLQLHVDSGFSSGDGDPYDGTLRVFRADPNLRQGLVLFEQLLAWQSGRTTVHASDPLLSGVPAEDLVRLASDGAVFNAVTLFPRIGGVVARPRQMPLEVYGGVLLAWASSPPTDPFVAKIDGGGYPRNYLGGKPLSMFLGSELDVGARLRWAFGQGDAHALQFATEYGLLLGGGALAPATGDSPTVHALRVSLSLLGR